MRFKNLQEKSKENTFYLETILKALVVPAGYEQDAGSLPHVFDNQLRRFIGAHFVQQTYNWKNSIKKTIL